ncbi:MAG: hypothetical protein ACRD0U_07545 [Acidimicrobiales bacterium]
MDDSAVAAPRLPPPLVVAPPAPPSRPGRKIVAFLAAGVLATGIGVVVARQGGHDYPDEWDPRVLDIVAFVERERGLDFDHPVYIDFLTPEQYTTEATLPASELSADDEQLLAQNEGMLRALGLAEGDLDLLDASNDISDQGTLAYYSPEEQRVIVRGTEMTVDVRVTMAHELTHALQHQHFGFGPEDDAPSGAHFAYRAILEGDAIRIEDVYVAGALSGEERQEYEEVSDIQSDAADLEEVPSALVAFFGAPYALGGGFVELLDADGGNRRIDEAFEDPPESEEQVFDPFAFLDGDGPDLLDTPDLPAGAELIEEGDFGAVGWFVMLSEWIEPLQALDATDGWRGDAFATYTQDDRTCVRLAWSGDEPSDLDEMEAALLGWAGALSAVAPSVDRDGTVLRVRACDPGAEVALGLTGRSGDALAYPASRSYIAAGAVRDGGLTLHAARCLADRMIHTFTLDELNASELPADYETRLREALSDCG